MTSQVQDVLACSHAQRVALKAAFHAPDDRAFECPKEQPKPRGAAVGEATFGGVRRRQFMTRRRRPRAKAPERRSLDEGPAHRCGGRPPFCIIAKGPKRRYKDGTKLNGRGVADSFGEGPVPKPWSKASSGDGSGSMLGTACQASCNPMRILYI